MITVSTDGSALGNPNGPMGWAWADHATPDNTQEHRHSGDSDAGGATNGTNQIGELCAVLEVLRAHPGSEPLTIETDSQYAINCSTKWVHGWKRNGWKNSQNKPVKNAALIKAIDAELSKRPGPVTFVWVKGHAGNPGNEKVDDLAHSYAGDARSKARDGYLPLEGWQSLMASEYAKGLDIPSDARMLIDGSISAEEYHMARGSASLPDVEDADSADTHDGTTKDSGDSERSDIGDITVSDNDDAQTVAIATDAMGGTDEDENRSADADDILPSADQESATTPSHAEGISDADAHEATANGETNSDSSEHSAASEASGSDTSDSAGSDSAVSDSSGSDSTQGNSTDNDSAHGNASTSPVQSRHYQRRASGLTVSGTLTFSPPPSSSATYKGRPRLVRGSIDIEGYVEGDGRIVITRAPFMIESDD